MSCRTRKFGNLRDVSCDRLRRDHVLVAERGFLSQAIEMTFGAITLDRSDGAGMAGVFIANSSLVDGKGILVGAGRGLSRRVVGSHGVDDSAARRYLWSVIPTDGDRKLMAFVRVLEIDGRQFVYAGRSDLALTPARPRQDFLPVDELLREKYRAPMLTDDQHEPAIRALLKDEKFEIFLSKPQGVFPVAVMPANLRREFPDHQFLAMTGGVVAKMRERHPDITSKKYQTIQLILSQGEVRYPDDFSGTMRAVYFTRGRGSWWRLMLTFPPKENAAEVVTFHRIAQRAYVRQNRWR